MASPGSYPRVASFHTPESFRQRIEDLGIALPFDDTLLPPDQTPLARPLKLDNFTFNNRFCILPMEGWDGTPDGHPSDLTRRRWRHFGASGASFIWGGEAVAVRHDGRANPNQLLIDESTVADLAELREILVREHADRFGSADGLLVGLQLTHSGRYSRPNESHRAEPLAAYHHPVLDRRFPAGVKVLADDDLDRLVEQFISASALAWRAGYTFVDVKHCHGYLGHELLSAVDRPGRYGGSLANRTRFLRNIVSGIRATTPALDIVVRVSAFDMVPFRKDSRGVGTPETSADHYAHAFGIATGVDDVSLDDARAFLEVLRDLGIRLVCITAGSPYYTPHIQRPALFPPSDGYLPPEDPLVGVARQIQVTARLKREFPELVFVGSAYTYLQDWLPNVAQRVIADGMADFIGLGRMVLAYPELPADVLAGRPLGRKSICRTFSDCTSGPRNGLVSGCFPLDPFYAQHPHAALLKRAKAKASTP
jgi:NADPH2 dehydrogenase